MWVATRILGLMAIQNNEELFQNYSIVSMNVIVDARPDVPLKILIANYGQKGYHINKNQTLVPLIPQRGEVNNTQIPISEILNIEEDK